MKKVALLALAAMAFFSCSQDEMPTTSGSNEEPIVILKINVQGAIGSRSIEDGHGGVTEVLPKIFNGAIIPYNEHGAALSAIIISNDQLGTAIDGSYRDALGNVQTGTGAGAKIGLPRGTKRVDIVLNRFTAAEKGITNINYFNMQDYKDLDGNPIKNDTKDNFDRVALVTQYQGVGMELTQSDPSAKEKESTKPVYNVEFNVSPSLARFEVFGAINVDEPKAWTDKYGNEWYEISADEFANFSASLNPTVDFDEDGVGSEYGLMKANEKNGFKDKNGAVYIPKYYWHVKKESTGTIEPIDLAKNVHTRAEIDATDNDINLGWVLQEEPLLSYVKNLDNIVKWNPHAFYAIDVEEIFINNIKIRGASYDASMHSWPGSASPLWKEWYNAFHLFGWHPKGISDDNAFLCRANMWDRIAGSAKTAKVGIPDIDGHNEMEVLTGKAAPISGKSVYADQTNSRNLGITTSHAAAYQIYSQSAATTDDKDLLAGALPHIILKVKAYKTAADYASGTIVKQKEFITINLFKDDTGRIRSFKAGSIYRLDMNDLRDSFVGEIPVPGGVSDKIPTDPIEPDPEMPGADLTVTVKIVPWKIINMKPEI